MRISFIISLFAVLLFLVSVLSGGCSGERKQVDLTGLDPGIEIKRLEQDLFAIDLDSIPEQLPPLIDKYGEFFDIFNYYLIRTGDPRSAAYAEHLKRFLTDFDIYRLRNEAESVFYDMSEIEAGLNEAFSHYMFYFPGYTIPTVYTYISGFNQSLITAEGILGIGLDKYLGRDHFFYSQLQLPRYQRYNMHPDKILSDCMITWAMTEFEFDDSADNLLSHMVYHGKLLYFADAVLPGQHDTLKTGFSPDELEWCKRNEAQMWTYIVENKLLFTTDARTIDRFINPGPFTAEFSRESPARAIVWLGWKIVDSYMNRHKDVSLEELMLDDDYQGILNGARYRP